MRGKKSHRDVALQIGLNGDKSSRGKQVWRCVGRVRTWDKDTILTKQANDALSGLEESKSVDASVCDRNVRERLRNLSIPGMDTCYGTAIP